MPDATFNLQKSKSELARQLISCVDLTCLDDAATLEMNQDLCQRAFTPAGNVAAICIWPQFIQPLKPYLAQLAEEHHTTTIPVATVINFPHGNNPLAASLDEISNALAAGANEIDLVMPYQQLVAGEAAYCSDYLQTCAKHCRTAAVTQSQIRPVLKIILETGCLGTKTLIQTACEIALQANPDFLKTSTGKVATGATLPACRTMAQAILQHMRHATSPRPTKCGLKISGGVRDYSSALQYAATSAEILGPDQIQAHYFRIGASSLLSDLIAQL